MRRVAFSSETKALSALGFTAIRELTNGEAVFVASDLSITSRTLLKRPLAHCVKEIFYFSNKASHYKGEAIGGHRAKLGALLKERIPESVLGSVDQITPIPYSAIPAASGLTIATGIPSVSAIVKEDIRTFTQPDQALREQLVRKAFSYIPSEIRNRSILIVDDTLIGGTVIKEIVVTLYQLGAKDVHVAIAAPPTRYDCDYGMNIRHNSDRPLVAKRRSAEEVSEIIGAKSLTYLSIDDIAVLGNELCVGCLTGSYPTAAWDDPLASVTTRYRSCPEFS